MTDQCAKCNGKCCRYFCLQIDEPETYEEFEDVRWYLCHEDVSAHIDDEGDWYLSVMNACRFLDEDNRCTIYEERPLICRSYTMDTCDYTQGDYEYKELFKTPEQFDRWVQKTLGKIAYRSAKTKARDKLARKDEKRMKKARDANEKVAAASSPDAGKGKSKAKGKKKDKGKKGKGKGGKDKHKGKGGKAEKGDSRKKPGKGKGKGKKK